MGHEAGADKGRRGGNDGNRRIEEEKKYMDIALSVAAFAISLFSAGFTLYTFIWTKVRDRKQATLEAYNRLQEQVLDHLNVYMPKQIAEIAKNVRSEEYKQMSAYVARIEHFCVGINQKIYDRNVVYELAKGYLDGMVKNRIEPIIVKKNRFGHDYYTNIHQFYDWMEKVCKEKERKGK